ncbi:hypothetical protein ACIPPS_01040 [Streptomyces sp. NPDC090127]|uniref:hypothetical protein n=1 Tax=Streptomyces sp. NPDC090127 TaxID=3365953 RepID=UPI003825D010
MTIKTEKTNGTDERADAAQTVEPVEESDETRDRELDGELDDELDDADEPDEAGDVPAVAAGDGIGAGAAAVVSVGLGLAALTGTWVGKVSSERETLVGQIKAQGGTAAQQINEIYADAWHATALVNGVFALLALIVAVLVLVRPQRPAWVRAVAVAGAVLGAIGVFLSTGMYFDLFLSLPTAP